MFDKVVLKPIKENKQIYDIKIGELKSVDKLPNYFYNSNNDDSLMPFILSFSVSLKKEYIDSIDSFLEKSSIEHYNASDSSYEWNAFNYYDIDNKGESDARYKTTYTYKFSENLENSYKLLQEDLIKNYQPNLIIKLKNTNNKLVKIINFSNKDYFEKTRLISTSFLDKIYNRDSTHHLWSCVISYGPFGILNKVQNLELGMYLSEDEIIKIKGATIEIKWKKIRN